MIDIFINGIAMWKNGIFLSNSIDYMIILPGISVPVRSIRTEHRTEPTELRTVRDRQLLRIINV